MLETNFLRVLDWFVPPAVHSRTLCRTIGGDVSIESGLGRGSRFTVRAPASIESGSVDWVSSTASLAESRGIRRAA